MSRLFFSLLILPCLCVSNLCALTFTPEQKAFFDEYGYLGPIPLLSQEEVETLRLELVTQPNHTPNLSKRREKPTPFMEALLNDENAHTSAPYGQPCYWSKSLHILVPKIADMGRSETFLGFVKDVLGPDVLLWGAQLVKKSPGRVHRWHADIEHTAWDGLTFWLPLNNVSSQSTIKFITRSHHFDTIPQLLNSKVNLESDQAVLEAIHHKYPDAQIVSMDIKPGEFIIFAGRTWHSTINETKAQRQALIFQYCRPEARVRIPVNFTIPTVWSPNQPWVIHVAGVDRYGINHLYSQKNQ